MNCAGSTPCAPRLSTTASQWRVEDARIRRVETDAKSIADAVRGVRERIAGAAKRANRDPGQIELVAVTKTLAGEALRAAYEAGVRHFGENRVQEWEAKRREVAGLEGQICHLIGHLQRNKARRAVALFDRIDSLDSLALGQKVEEYAAEAGRLVPVLLEVHLSPEPAKSGIEPESLDRLGEAVLGFAHLDWLGLMTVPPWSEEGEPARPYFRRLRELAEGLRTRFGRPLEVLSMGMSHDFEVAIEEGATEVRIGTAIFGRRSKPPGTP